MMNDPLLPPPPPPVAQRSVTAKRKPKKPATSAKILVTGLSATAVFGMAAGYALAGKASTQANVNSVNTVDGISRTAQPQAQGAALLPVQPAITSNSVANPPVVQVPVPKATPATPGTASSGWQQQKSSGSH